MEHLTEEDVKTRLITPALQKSGWCLEQMRMEKTVRRDFQFTDGKVIIKGKTAKRGNPLKADYILEYHGNFPKEVEDFKILTKNEKNGSKKVK